jgi:transposase-like protein
VTAARRPNPLLKFKIGESAEECRGDPSTAAEAGPELTWATHLVNEFVNEFVNETKTNALESLVIAGFVRGLSTRDVEAVLVEALGESAAVSKSTVSRICAEIKTQFEAFSARRLDDVELAYLFLDGSHFKYHANASAEPVLAAWGIDTDGKPVLSG